MNTLGFDTVVVNVKLYSKDDIQRMFEIFIPAGINNFIFVCDFNTVADNLTFKLESAKKFKNEISVLAPRGVHIKTAQAALFEYGISQNPYCRKISVSRKDQATFISLPIFPDLLDNRFATEINKLLYGKKMFPIFSNFDSITKTAPNSFTSKLISTNHAGFVYDINFLTDTSNINVCKSIVNHGTSILPSISHDIGNYVGILNASEHLLEALGKTAYYRLCSSINKCSAIIGF